MKASLMADRDITQIKVGQFGVGIIGMKALMEEMAKTHAEMPDNEIGSFMLERLGKNNYIPTSAKEEYGQAFAREFRRYLGKPYTEEAGTGIEVRILSTGCCNQCQDLMRITMEVLTEIDLPASVDHVTDIKEIARRGIMGTPALLINGKVVFVGSIPPREKIKKWLIEAGRFRESSTPKE